MGYKRGLVVLDKRLRKSFDNVKVDVTRRAQKKAYEENNLHLKTAFIRVKKDVYGIHNELEKRKYHELKDQVKKVTDLVTNELVKLAADNKQLEVTLRKILDLEYNFREFKKIKEEVKDFKEEVKSFKSEIQENYSKSYELHLLKDKTDAEAKNLKEMLKNLKTESATKESLEKTNKKIESEAEKAKKNFEKIKKEVKTVENNAVGLEELHSLFLTKETLEKELDAVDKTLESVKKQDDKATKKHVEKISDDVHEKVNVLRKELDNFNERISHLHTKVDKTVDQEELLKLSKDFINVDEHKKHAKRLEDFEDILNNVQFSDSELKKLRSNVDNIIVSLVPKKEHEKIIETIHKKLESLKEDIEEMAKK